MKMKRLLTAALLIATVTCFGQKSTTWDNWNWLLGEWKGEGGGQPGQGEGTFSFSFDLDKKIIVRNSHSEYPAIANNPEVIHDDLMIIYLDTISNPTKAIYFDNEGHIINYSIIYTDNSIVMTGDKTSNALVFRLTYTLLEKDRMNTKFEMSQDGEHFFTYVEGKSVKMK